MERSQHFGAYLFETNMRPSADVTVVIEVLRDDQLELRFFQVIDGIVDHFADWNRSTIKLQILSTVGHFRR